MEKRKWVKINPSDFMIRYKSHYYGVYGYIGEVDEYIDGKAYIDKERERAYICSKTQPQSTLIPVVKVNDMNEVVSLIEPVNMLPEDTDPFNLKNIIRISRKVIEEDSSNCDELYNEQALSDMNSATSIYVPIINDKDDPPKKLVKETIMHKQVDINKYKSVLGAKYAFANIKAGLNNGTKTSSTVFDKWMELFECGYYIIVYDQGTDVKTPLPIPLVYSSEKGRVEELSADDIKRMIKMLELKLSDIE